MVPATQIEAWNVVDSENTKYAKIAQPLVDKTAKELNHLDYKFTKIELGK